MNARDGVSTHDFFAALYAGCAGVMELRALPSTARAFCALGDTEQFVSARRTENCYFGVATRRDATNGALHNCLHLPVLFVDLDFKRATEARVRHRLSEFALAPSAVVRTGGGLHAYWRLKEPAELPAESARIGGLLRRLARAFPGGDVSAAEPARILRIPGSLNHKAEYGAPRPVLLEAFFPEAEYTLADFEGLLAVDDGAQERADPAEPGAPIPEGERNSTLYALARALLLNRITPAGVVAALLEENRQRCIPPLPEPEVRAMVAHAAAQPHRSDFVPPAPDGPGAGVDAFEVTLKPEALYGLAGRVVEAIDPHTEASKVATLAHLLVGIGNLIGPGPHALVGHDVHPCRLNAALVGPTSKGRKGMSRSGVMAVLRRVDESWSKTRVASGLSTSEGLIYHVRDAREDKQPVKDHGRVVDYESVIVDHGVDDKRLFVEEPEMASVLRRMDREGNALSATIRQAWDSGELRTLTRGSPLQATGAHISIVSHITVEELRLNLTHSDRANGFANRFLFLLTKRSKCLPDPRPLPSAGIERLAADMGEVFAFARTAGEIPRDAEAREMWADIYPALSEERPGMFGAVTARAEAQVLRLAVLYAVLDCSFLVRPEHLKAALALWDYADASARIIFGTKVGDLIADTILTALRTQGSKTRNQIRDLFNRNVDAERITVALAALETQGKVRMTKQETGGRPAEHWEAV